MKNHGHTAEPIVYWGRGGGGINTLEHHNGMHQRTHAVVEAKKKKHKSHRVRGEQILSCVFWRLLRECMGAGVSVCVVVREPYAMRFSSRRSN